MLDPQIPDNTTRQVGDLVASAGEIGVNVVKLGVAALTGPLYLLPAGTREDALDAARDLVGAVGKLHLGLTKVVIDGVDTVANTITKATAPAPVAVPPKK